MRRLSLGLGATAALLACAASPVLADVLEVRSPGARNIAAGSGYVVWAARSEYGGWRLVVRDPDGTVRVPAIRPFGAPPDPAIGLDRFAIDGRRVLAVYSRCAANSTISGCDVYRFHLNGGDGEERVDRLATKTYSETAPSIASGRYTLVRRGGGARHGVHYWRGDTSAPRRVSRIVARETATNGSRVAYALHSRHGGGLAVRRLSGEGAVLMPAARRPSVPRSILLDRYHVTWISGRTAFQTARLSGARSTADVVVHRGSRRLPEGTGSVTAAGNRITWALTPLGVVALSPRLRFG